MAAVHQEIEPLRQLRYTLDQLKLNKLAVGGGGFNRCWLNPFGGRTSRNQPSNARFIFGPAVWLRDFLIQPKEGCGLAYIDYIGQEAAIAAALSGDQEYMYACASGDVHHTFGKQAGMIPKDAQEGTYESERNLCKNCSLGTQFGMRYKTLGERTGLSDIGARHLLELHHKIYRTFWKWSDNQVQHALLHKSQRTRFGWIHKFKEPPNPNAVRNWPIQSHGAEILRLAACFGTEDGISICAPVHDAFLIMAPLSRLEADIARMRGHMAEASRVVLKGFEIRTDVHRTLYPDHYSDPKGRGKEMLATVLNLLYE
jgi:DNA polymerase I